MDQSIIIQLCKDWNKAMITNDADLIASYMTADWEITGSDGITSKAEFLSGITSGKLIHNRMDADEYHVKLYDHTAIVTSKGTSAGTWEGKEFKLYEWSQSVFIHVNGKWLCACTMLTPATTTYNSD